MSAVKNLQQWCRVQCNGYRDVSITNMTTSFRDGLAFCALIHKHRPDLINFDSLKKENVFDNNKLAFMVAEEQLGIPALLDAEDMVALKVPDRLSILTYVSQYYNYFHGRSPIGGMAGIKRPADEPTDEPSGKKNQPVTAKVFPSNKPARENSPPPSSNITRPSPSPKASRTSPQDVLVEKPRQTGTLSNKCVVCNGHVHLVQRYLVDGKLYHRNCAKTVQSTSAPHRDFPSYTNVSRFNPPPSSSKTSTTTPSTPSKQGPTWLTNKTSTSPSVSSSVVTSPPEKTQTAFVSKPAASHGSTFATTFSTGATSKPTAAPLASTTAAKTQESKLKFLQGDNKEKVTTSINVDVNKGQGVRGKTQEVTAGQTVSLVVNVGGKAASAGGKVSSKQEDTTSNKTKAAAAFLSKKLAEENNNNNSKPSWTTVALKKTDKPKSQVETPTKETGSVRGKVKLKANPALLGDLYSTDPPSSTTSPAGWSGLAAKTPDRGASKPVSEIESSPADWRSSLKPVSKPAGSSQPSAKPLINGAGKTSGFSVGPSSSSAHPPGLSISVTAPASKEINGPEDEITNGTKSESKISKTKPDYIPKEAIMKELQEIDDQLNELEKRGVELEKRLRRSDEGEGEDDSLMDEWFNLIRKKQLAMRRESELVYIGRNQDLEEQQPTVEQELRRLMEKPDHLKTARDKKREEELMAKLVEIINDRNSIVEGLDEDRLREEEEDEELNKMMKNLNVKDKSKTKSPMSKVLKWLKKKEE
ncbi:MICAL-like protein 2 [Mugil cephalus]|uniref:MICAL-like protein 2 n=1 Tax=Mugil cephalus TaxID=48193 RepID=UPI001FB778E1|nr:MICAL-like protein 2 [Mugil cephalus]